ncbi:MAG: tRNA (guanosine(37)-N1)-methyltransferase TrmD [Candidatus Pacebacteria bacterium]|nr:tRNA (guanosine(37)-N1)-methyltransferase TrmD [Candidatus Paceibacterota bacterium]
MNFHIITLFPDSFDSYLNESILARAIKNKKIKVNFFNPRDFVKIPKSQKGKDKPYKRVDDIPYGGGPGMVMQVEPIMKAMEKALKKIQNKKRKIKIIFLSPEGKQFDTEYAKNSVKKYTDIIVICGRYEGIDERINKIFKTEKITVGPFVLTGGELPAMIMIDCIARQIDGVLGNFSSREEERISSSEVYTRPEIFKYKNKTYKVPEVLLSGNHKKIDEWRRSV